VLDPCDRREASGSGRYVLVRLCLTQVDG
jgi:hypothetical protein